MGERRTGIFSTIAKIVAATRKQSNNFRNLKQTNESIVVQLASATVSHLKTSTHQATGGGGGGGLGRLWDARKAKTMHYSSCGANMPFIPSRVRAFQFLQYSEKPTTIYSRTCAVSPSSSATQKLLTSFTASGLSSDCLYASEAAPGP